jgi:large subunit ribosomal protein L25
MSFDTNVSLTAKSRTERGKNAARRLRAAGFVPVTVYGGGLETASTTIAKREFATLLRTHGRNKVFVLNIDGSESPVKIADLQLDPIKGTLIHADLMRISLTEKSKFNVPIKMIGESEGVKLGGGILDVVNHTLEVRCLPGDLPAVVEVDVTNLVIGDHLSVKDLNLGDKIEILDDPNSVIVTLSAPRAEETPEVVTETTAEPEVIKKGKIEEKA